MIERRRTMIANEGHRAPWKRIVFAAAFAAAILLALPGYSLDVPPPPQQWYNDSASLLDASQSAALNEKLRAFEQQSGAQFIIYVFPSLEGEAIEDFTIRCAEKWKVGNKKYDNGLILFVFVKERKIRIEVGYGLEGAVTDAFSSRVIREYIAPHFRQNDYAGGLNAAADALMAKIRGEEPAREPVSPGAQGSPGTRTSANTGIPCSPGLLLMLIIVAIFVLPQFLMPRRRGCGGCIWPLFFMGGGGGGTTFGGGGGFGGFGGGGGGFGGGGFSGGGGGFGGGGATGGW